MTMKTARMLTSQMRTPKRVIKILKKLMIKRILKTQRSKMTRLKPDKMIPKTRMMIMLVKTWPTKLFKKY